ncbi:hypothetical protein WISP_143385 [Willisornis vidua]|uniref:Rna-directed dna polymerase from mobile element jockey-like n=1 Tax=Willisornis vidua TaxID=1566151 RepID=A0ABQ9CLF5_9PASS|nr:hypothetical protein WISP_143385 [Willisornis vidua]
MKFNEAKCNILHVSQGNPNPKHRLEREWIKSSPEEKDFEVLVDEKLKISWQHASAAQKTNHVLGCTIRTGPCWSKSRGGHEDAQRAGAPLLWRQPERICILQNGEEKVLGRP